MYKRAGLAVWVCVFCVELGIAQTTGTISGTVRDATGGVVPGASITVKNVETGITRSMPTDAQGRYQAPNLSVGRYEIQASISGFRTEVRSGIDLTVGQEAVVNLTLQVGQVSEKVEVTGEAPLVETTNATITGLVDQQKIRDLPLNGRSFDQLLQLQVGTVNARNNQGTTGLGGGTKISISGVRPHANSWLLDGTDISDPRGGVPGGAGNLSLGVDTVREFRVLTNAYTAEYGRASGGVITAVTRSGTNDLHGTVFEFLRNAKLDAAKWEATARSFSEKPPFKRNQFGFTLGGPIKENRTFFFGSYEGLRDRLGITKQSNVPTALSHQGIMPENGLDARTLDPVKDAAKIPAACKPIPTINCNAVPVPGGIRSGVLPWLALFPLPNGHIFDKGDGTGEFSYTASQPTNENYFTIKADHTFSSKHSIFGRYTRDYSDRIIPRDLPFGSDPNRNQNQYLTVQLDSTLSPATLNSFRFGLNKSHAREAEHTELPSGSSSFVPGVPFDFGGELNVTGLAQIGTYDNPRGTDYSLFEWSDDVTLVRGAHTLKTGFIFKKTLDFEEAVTARAGRYDIAGGLWDFLQGRAIGAGSQLLLEWPGSPADRDWRQNLVGAYLQDDFKLKSNLTLNLGVREEFMTSPNEVNGKCADITSVVDTAPRLGCPLFHTLKNNWAPRAGFAWDTRSNAKLVVRGGFGLFYDQPFSTYWRTPGRTFPPYTLNASLTDTTPQGKLLFPSGIPFPNGLAGIDLTKPPDTGKLGGRGINYTGTAYAMQYNFNIQSQLSQGASVTLGYVGSQGRKTYITRQVNVNHWIILPDGRKCFPAYVLSASGAVVPPTGYNGPPSPCPFINQGPLNPLWGNLSMGSMEGVSSYNGLVASLNQRFRGGLRLQASYTFSKVISLLDTVFGSDFNGDATGGPTDAYNMAQDRGLAAYSVKHNFVLNYSYDLPFKGTGFKGKLVQGWQLSGITTRQSGIPFTVGTALKVGDGAGALGGAGGSPSNRPDLVPGKSNNPVLGGPDKYFDASAFAPSPLGVFGTVGRHTMIGPGLVNFDFSLIKNTAITERANLQFRAELFNILNHPNFDNPITGGRAAGVATVFDARDNATVDRGRILTTNTDPREIQFALKLIF